MSSRIFRNIVLTAILSVLITAGLIVVSMYTVYEERISHDLKLEAGYIRQALDVTDKDIEYLQSLSSENRLTLIAFDGYVLFDNTAEWSRMENHAERPEIVAAMDKGYGESTRDSGTLSQVTMYYAEKTDDGAIIRVASTRSSIWGAFAKILPVTICLLLCVVIASILLARNTAMRIVAPLNALNLEQPLENETYDELAPLLTRMHQQRTQIHNQLEELESSHAKLAVIMENMREGMILLDQTSAVLSMNSSAGLIFGVDTAKAVGENLLYVYRDAELLHLVQSVLQGEEDSFSFERNHKHYIIYVSPVIKEQIVHGTVLLIVDVTERFIAEESRKEFTANVSHELKTPLTSISGLAEIIRDGIAQPQDIQRFAGTIFKESARMIALVNDILELSQLDEQQNLGQKESVALKPLLQGLVNDFTMSAQNKNLRLSLSVDDAQINGYPLLLREMFFNLIDNAIKYTPEGGKVQVTVEVNEDKVRCTVSDTGIGIPDAHQSRVFERFYRVDKSHSRSTGGTGLGLAIVKHVAQIHQAELKLTSSEGQGTAVNLVFAAAHPIPQGAITA